ncbi:MAG: hypothetical protein A2Y91_03275 [Chloroflexi bacterium RBG_13_54_8]|nr:MAG: hypothetical protein A2Y91_03275 [Chloroflexi bacterium RBG_13_54_8]
MVRRQIPLTVLLLLVLALSLGGACGQKDTTPPTAPTNLSCERFSEWTLLFSWEGSTDEGSGVYSYLIRIVGEPLYDDWFITGSSLSFPYSAPLSEGSHIFQVKAVDEAGNEGPVASLEFQS